MSDILRSPTNGGCDWIKGAVRENDGLELVANHGSRSVSPRLGPPKASLHRYLTPSIHGVSEPGAGSIKKVEELIEKATSFTGDPVAELVRALRLRHQLRHPIPVRRASPASAQGQLRLEVPRALGAKKSVMNMNALNGFGRGVIVGIVSFSMKVFARLRGRHEELRLLDPPGHVPSLDS
ncbi:hypothetical protein [Streptomyces sp. NPDC050564]|uniref:hypothetical protein n=1 Tax=Streptomyces sp. NPDC050564 TaxID=3365631 RepID=UPI0037B8A786